MLCRNTCCPPGAPSQMQRDATLRSLACHGLLQCCGCAWLFIVEWTAASIHERGICSRACIGMRFPGKDEQKKRLRLELMRWHPDKFHSRFRTRLVAKDADRILERVESQTKALNALAARNRSS